MTTSYIPTLSKVLRLLPKFVGERERERERERETDRERGGCISFFGRILLYYILIVRYGYDI